MTASHLTDDEIAGICRPLRQNAARVRYLRGLGVPVERRPDGTPLVRRSDWDRLNNVNKAPAVAPRWRTSR